MGSWRPPETTVSAVSVLPSRVVVMADELKNKNEAAKGDAGGLRCAPCLVRIHSSALKAHGAICLRHVFVHSVALRATCLNNQHLTPPFSAFSSSCVCSSFQGCCQKRAEQGIVIPASFALKVVKISVLHHSFLFMFLVSPVAHARFCLNTPIIEAWFTNALRSLV